MGFRAVHRGRQRFLSGRGEVVFSGVPAGLGEDIVIYLLLWTCRRGKNLKVQTELGLLGRLGEKCHLQRP